MGAAIPVVPGVLSVLPPPPAPRQLNRVVFAGLGVQGRRTASLLGREGGIAVCASRATWSDEVRERVGRLVDSDISEAAASR